MKTHVIFWNGWRGDCAVCLKNIETKVAMPDIGQVGYLFSLTGGSGCVGRKNSDGNGMPQAFRLVERYINARGVPFLRFVCTSAGYSIVISETDIQTSAWVFSNTPKRPKSRSITDRGQSYPHYTVNHATSNYKPNRL